MKISSAIAIALILVVLPACSDQENTAAAKNSEAQTTTSTLQSTSKVLEPLGDIKNAVLD